MINKKLKEHQKNSNYLNTPCTIVEATQIARGVAEDVVSEYQSRAGHLQVSLSLQVELLKEIVIGSGMITEEEFKARYIKKAEEFNEMQKKAMEMYNSPEQSSQEETSPNMSLSVDDIEVEKL